MARSRSRFRRSVGAIAVVAVVAAGCGGASRKSGPTSPSLSSGSLPSGRFVVLSPGPVLDVLGDDGTGKPVIEVMGHATNSTTARLDITTVEAGPPISGAAVVAARRRSDVEVVPYAQVSGSTTPSAGAGSSAAGTSTAASVDSAVAAAMCELGFPKALTVLATDPAAPAARVLKAGDALVSVDGQRVTTAVQLLALLARHAPTRATLEIRRGGRPTEVTAALLPPAAGGAGARLGVTVDTRCQAPFSVHVNGLGAISGPSVGLIIALGVRAKLGHQQLAGSLDVAGTGTVGSDGTVGAVSGAKAEQAGARAASDTTFLVPSANCPAVRGAPLAAGSTVIKVDTLHDAWQALTDLQAGRPVPHC